MRPLLLKKNIFQLFYYKYWDHFSVIKIDSISKHQIKRLPEWSDSRFNTDCAFNIDQSLLRFVGLFDCYIGINDCKILKSLDCFKVTIRIIMRVV